MRLVVIVDRAWRGITPSGGAEVMIADMSEYLAGNGWDVHAVVLNGKPSCHNIGGVQVTVQPEKNELHRIFSLGDVALTQLAGTPQARGMGKTYNIPVAQLIHNTSEYSVGFLGEGCDLAIYNAQWVKDFHEVEKTSVWMKSWQKYGHSDLKLRRCNSWPSIVVRPPSLEPFRDIADPHGYITLVNLVPNKGPDVFYELARRNPHLQFMGVIGGYEQDQQVIEDLPNVKIHLHTADMDEVYSQTFITLMPSIYESYGKVAVESIGRGIPVVVSDTPGLKECLGNKGLSILVRDRDQILSWEQAIAWIQGHYDLVKYEAMDRYLDLQDQSVADLLHFKDALEGLVNTWDSSLSRT